MAATMGASSLGPVLAPIVADPFRLNQVLEALRAYSLIRRNPAGKTLSIHRLVQAVLQETLSEEERHIWRERALLAVNAAFPHAEHEVWSQCERLLTQAFFVAQSIEQDQVRGEEVGRLLHETASYLTNRARYAEAEPLYQRALRIREQALGPDHSDLAISLTGLGNLYFKQGKYIEAEPLYQRAQRIWEQTQVFQHPQKADTMRNLARLREAQGNYEEARSLYARALVVREQVLGVHHPKTTETRTLLIALLHAMGQHEEAARLEERQSKP